MRVCLDEEKEKEEREEREEEGSLSLLRFECG